MAELIYFEVLRDLKSLGYDNYSIDADLLHIPWVDDLEFMEDEEDDG